MVLHIGRTLVQAGLIALAVHRRRQANKKS